MVALPHEVEPARQRCSERRAEAESLEREEVQGRSFAGDFSVISDPGGAALALWQKA